MTEALQTYKPEESAVQAAPVSDIMSLIAKVASDPNVDVTKFQAIIDMKHGIEDRNRRIQQEDSEKEQKKIFYSAFSRMQADMPTIVDNKKNDHARYTYADIEQFMRTLRPVFKQYGFAVSHENIETDNDDICIRTTLMHEDGYSLSTKRSAKPDGAGAQGKTNKTAVQAVGSTSTYLQRYNLRDLLGLSTGKDDDGQAAAPVRMLTEVQQDQIKEKLLQTNEVTKEWFKETYGTVSKVPVTHFGKLFANLEKAAAAAQSSESEAQHEDS